MSVSYKNIDGVRVAFMKGLECLEPPEVVAEYLGISTADLFKAATEHRVYTYYTIGGTDTDEYPIRFKMTEVMATVKKLQRISN